MTQISVLFLLLVFQLSAVLKADDFNFTYLGSRLRDSDGKEFIEDNYYASTFAGVWNNVIQDCKGNFGPEGHLVSIETKQESDDINRWLEERGSGGATFWTSGIYGGGTWLWAGTGDAVNFTNWEDGQPVPSPTSRYRIALNHRSMFLAGWHSVQDTETLRFICEYNSNGVDPTGSTVTPTTTPAPTTLPPEDVPTDCHSDLDLAIVLDSSGSIGSDNYIVLKSFVANLTSAFVQNSATRFTFVVYSEGAETVIPLVNFLTPAQILDVIRSARYHAGPTPTDLGILFAKDQLTQNQRASPQVMLVITDGVSNDPERTKQAADEAISAGIQPFVLGITDYISQQELLNIAGGNRNNVFISEDWDSLRFKLKSISEALCP